MTPPSLLRESTPSDEQDEQEENGLLVTPPKDWIWTDEVRDCLV